MQKDALLSFRNILTREKLQQL